MSQERKDRPDYGQGHELTSKDPAEAEKLSLEINKLKQEVFALQSGNSFWGMLTRNIWPLVSGLLAIAVSLVALSVSWQAQRFTFGAESKKTFFTALQMATDAKAGQDARIAGIWTLSDYWHDPQYSEAVANSVAAVLVTDPDDNSAIALTKVQRLRDAAAVVIGNAIHENTESYEATRLRKLLYGDGPTGSLGAITRYQQGLTALKMKLSKKGEDVEPIELRLQATREAIRQNWENLEFGMFSKHDLTGIILYKPEHTALSSGTLF